jgi:hypothetical protein
MNAGRSAGVEGSQGPKSPWVRPLVIPFIGLLIAGLGLVLTIWVFHEPFYEAVFLGLLILILTMQLELIRRTGEVGDDQSRRTEEAVERARDHAVFSQKLEQSPWAKDLIEEIVHGVATIDATQDDNDVFRQTARSKLEECSADIGDLAEGRIQADPGQAHRLMLNLADKVKAKGTIKAVAISNPENEFSWWATDLAKAYWERNREALDREVDIERVFVFQRDISVEKILYSQDQRLKEMRQLLTTQVESGVHVYVVTASRLPPNLHIDLVIFDDDFLYEMRLKADGEPWQYRCSSNQSDIRRRNGDFEIIKAAATQPQIDRFAKIARDYGSADNDRKVVVEPPKSQRFWVDCLTGSREWLGVSYTPSDQSWHLTIPSDPMTLQKEVIDAGGTIKRVFVFDNKGECLQLQQVMNDQKGIGIKVRWIMKEELLKALQNSPDLDEQEEVEILDCAVVDDSWVYRNYRNESKRLFRSEAIKDMDMTEKFRSIFYTAFEEGNRLDE